MKNIFKIWFFTIYFLLSKILYFQKFKYFEEEKKEKEIFRLLKEYDNYILKKLEMDMNILGSENLQKNDNTLYISNHPSMLDAFFLLNCVNYPISFFIAEEGRFVSKLPIIKHFYTYMQNIFIDRNNLRSGIKSIKEGTESLKNNFNLAIFPEGRITKTISNDLVGNFKPGSFKVALNAKKSITPISIITEKDVQKDHTMFSPIFSQKIKILIHPTIPYDEFKNLTTEEITINVQNIIKKGIMKENFNVQ